MARKKEAPVEDPGSPSATILPIRCMGCGAAGALELPGPAPWQGAVLRQKEWSVFNDPEEGQVVFACGKCSQGELGEAESPAERAT
ncbi:MAG TPA: hypothetical protein VGV89_04165 [Thermoplasmata archaeon]|nr:hypothetical protein [Thermoplasmata archaeon]